VSSGLNQRIVSATTFPIGDSQVRPTRLPHWSERGIAFVASPIWVLTIGASCAWSSSIFALDGGIGRDADRPRAVEVSRLVDDFALRDVDREPDPGESDSAIEVLGQDDAVGAIGEHLQVVVVADDGVDVRDRAGDVDRRARRVGERPRVGVLVPERGPPRGSRTRATASIPAAC
jgi:hypothetical protein